VKIRSVEAKLFHATG